MATATKKYVGIYLPAKLADKLRDYVNAQKKAGSPGAVSISTVAEKAIAAWLDEQRGERRR